MDEAVAPSSQGSGDLPKPSPSTFSEKPKAKSRRKTKSSDSDTPAKVLITVRDSVSGKFISPSLVDTSVKERAKGDKEVKTPSASSPSGSFPSTGPGRFDSYFCSSAFQETLALQIKTQLAPALEAVRFLPTPSVTSPAEPRESTHNRVVEGTTSALMKRGSLRIWPTGI